MNTKRKFQFNINTWLPIFVFVLIFIVFTILTKGRLLSGRNLTNIFNQSVATIIAAAGMMFVAAMGGTDISTGVVVALAGTFGLMAADSSNSIVFILISIAIGIASGMLLGFVNAKLKVNSFMASLALMMAYRALVNLIVSNKSYYLPEDLEFLDNTVFKIIVVIVILLIVFYIWNYTRIGNYIRGIGENEVAIQHTGVNVVKMKIIAFTTSGLLAAIAGIFFVARNGGVSNTTGSGFEMKVMMALYIAGMPVAGGEGTRVYKLIFGAPTIIMLENGLTLCGLDAGVTQLVRGLVLLAAVCLSSQLANKMAYVGQSGAVNQKAEAAQKA